MSFERVADAGALSDGQLLSVQLEGGARICLAMVGGEVYAVDDRCTHAEYPLSDGELDEDCRLECPLHGAVFDVRDGTVLGPPAEDTLRTYRVKTEEGGIWVEP